MTLIVFAIFLIFIHIIANFTLAEGGSKNQTVMAANFIPLTLEFGGGMELLFQNRKSIKINVPVPEGGLRIRELLSFIRDEVKPDRPELFMQEDTIRPGVLILINENDWELEGGLNAELNLNDSILFISTLHGG